MVIEGQGAAHGMGLAMDGVQGQARAGWPYRKILGLFYKGAVYGKTSAPIRVGVASSNQHAVVLPEGGTVSDAPPGGRAGSGFPLAMPAGARVVIAYAGGNYTVRATNVVGAAQADPSPSPTPTSSPAQSPLPGPSDSPSPAPTEDPPEEPSPPGRQPGTTTRPVWVVPKGSPALTRLETTGYRYRGRFEMRYSATSGSLWAVNHVDMESYVQGIAEEKGAGWPVEGLKVLAVASRSLAEATRTWYSKHHVNGFDICPTGACQVYLGYDGEEPSMVAATRATSGEILTHGGRAILAMYHGNGGGKTDTHGLIYGNGSRDAHPYLSAVEYPFANIKRWNRTFYPAQVSAAAGVPGELQSVEILQRGDSPRVRKMRLTGSRGSVEMTGIKFMEVLGLPSAWFDVKISTGEPPPPEQPAAPVPVEAGTDLAAPPPQPVAVRPDPPLRKASSQTPSLIALAVVCLAGAVKVSADRLRLR